MIDGYRSGLFGHYLAVFPERPPPITERLMRLAEQRCPTERADGLRHAAVS
jgi:hypothetical protein